MNILIQETRAFLLLPFLIAALIFFIRKDFVVFSNKKQQEEYKKGLKRQRTVVTISRIIILICLIIALAQPAKLEQKTVAGDPTLKLLIDNSESFGLFDKTTAEKMKTQLEHSVPVSVKAIAENRSAIGDSILFTLQGNDNLLLITDGNNNYGRELSDIMLVASMLNSTINAVELEPVKDDTSVTVTGPSETTADIENEFIVKTNQVGNEKSYTLEVTVDNEKVIEDTFSGTQEIKFKKQLGEGYHRIEARIQISDYFPQNNIFYKTIKVQPKPKVLLLSPESPLTGVLADLYELTQASEMPTSTSEYSAVIINNKPLSTMGSIDKLSQYVVEGNGLVIIGGKNSFDKTNYKSSEYKTLEALLPVTVGKGAMQERKDVNIILVIDISGSTGGMFSKSSASTVEEVEKALAIGILGDIKKTDNVAVVAFNTDAYVISELTMLSGKFNQLAEDIEKLQYTGGTDISVGIRKAIELMQGKTGSKNIIVLSDGISATSAEDIRAASVAAAAGIHVYTAGVGESTEAKHMQSIASAGAGIYFEPTERQRLKIIFGEGEEAKGETYNLQIVDAHHFITEGINIDAVVNGFNFVVPKPSASMLIATSQQDPILTVWRFGLGRVAALSTDDGTAWAGNLLNQKNSKIISRTVNWAIGDLSRNKAFDVKMKDIYLGEAVRVDVKSKEIPKSELQFSKTGQGIYSAGLTPEQEGFYEVLGAIVAVNHNKEYSKTGLNPELKKLVDITGGKMFKPDQIKEITQKVRQDSTRTEYKKTSYAWPFIITALITLLTEIAYRRLEKLK